MQLSRFVVTYEGVRDDENVLYDVITDRHVGVNDAVLDLVRRFGAGPPPEDEDEAEIADALSAQGFLVEDRAADDERLRRHLARVTAEGMPETMYVVLTPTLKCNLACTYCYQKDSPAFNRMSAETEAESIAFVLRKVDEARTPKLHVHYLGGEVLTRKDFLLRTAEAFHAAMRERGGSFEWEIVTNGVDLDRPFVEAMNRCGEGTIKITLDGDRETHDAARVHRNGKGSFDDTFRNLVEVAGSARIWIGGNFYPGQDASYERLLDRIEDAGVAEKLSHVRFKPVVETGGNENKTGCTSCASDGKREADTLIHLDRLVRKKWKGAAVSKTLVARGPCELHWDNSYIIDPDGYVYRCPALVGHSDLAVGTVKSDALRAAPLLETRPWEAHEPCHDCAYLPVCMGGCLGGQWLKTGRRDQVMCKKEVFEASYAETIPARYLEELGAVPWDGDEAAPPQTEPIERSDAR